jgi:hypothetical protein
MTQKEDEDDCDWRCEMKMGTEADVGTGQSWERT